MVLQKLEREVYRALPTDIPRPPRNPAVDLIDKLTPYGTFTQLSQVLEEDADGRDNISLDDELAENPSLSPRDPEIVRTRWAGEIPCINGCNVYLSQASYIDERGLKCAVAILEYLPPKTDDAEESLRQLKEFFLQAGLKRHKE